MACHAFFFSHPVRISASKSWLSNSNARKMRKFSKKNGLVRARAGRDFDDNSNYYPWNSSKQYIRWVEEDTITFFTSDGLIRLGGAVVPQRVDVSNERVPNKYQRYQEEDYMDPHQRLCLGALFDISATNGLDLGRRFCLFGFCRSIEMLCDVVEDTVLEQGGEVLVTEKESREGLNEKLIMTVVVPFLWGVPPAADKLHVAVQSGGGIVDKVNWRWNFM